MGVKPTADMTDAEVQVAVGDAIEESAADAMAKRNLEYFQALDAATQRAAQEPPDPPAGYTHAAAAMSTHPLPPPRMRPKCRKGRIMLVVSPAAGAAGMKRGLVYHPNSP